MTGEIGAGHTVTALYEVVPAGGKVDLPGVDPLKYIVAPRLWAGFISMPLLAMTGSGDSQWRRDCARELAAIAPRGKFATIEAAGHLANLDRPDIFNRTTADFLLKCGLDKTS